MGLTGKKLDLILGMKLTDFYNATRKANVHYTKMKGNIEKSPVRIKASGTNDILKKLGLISAAYMALRKVSIKTLILTSIILKICKIIVTRKLQNFIMKMELCLKLDL